MNHIPIHFDKQAAREALAAYKAHRNTYDKRDWEIERIYRAIAAGKKVIAALESIRAVGLDDKGRPKLAICRADAESVLCQYERGKVTFGLRARSMWRLNQKISVSIPEVGFRTQSAALLPRIPPQYRPQHSALSNYHVLWEAEWEDIPCDPMLLRRIGKDAWVVLAAWDLTAVEMSVLRAERHE